MVQGSSALLKVTAARSSDFTTGDIRLALRNLPKQLKASSPRIQFLTGEIEVFAADDAVPGDAAALQVVGTAMVGGDPREVTFGPVALRILEPVSLRVQPARVELGEGDRAVLTVSAERRNYAGPITVEVRNLPEGVTASKAEIARDEQNAEVRLTATSRAAAGEKADVQVVGRSSTNKQFVSNNITEPSAAACSS